jgi:hypothetical protein
MSIMYDLLFLWFSHIASTMISLISVSIPYTAGQITSPLSTAAMSFVIMGTPAARPPRSR